MREVYEQSPQMGDAGSLEPRLEEVKQSLQKLEEELRRNQVYASNTTDTTNTHSTYNIQWLAKVFTPLHSETLK